MPSNKDTITAIATPPGRSGIGVIRVSGEKSAKIYKSLTGKNPENRYARHSIFKSTSNKLLDKGVSLFFKDHHRLLVKMLWNVIRMGTE